MKYKDLESDTIIIEWLCLINASANTKRNYLFSMQAYTDFCGKTPDELLAEAESEISQGVLPRQRKVKQYMLQFRMYLQEQKLAPKSIKARIAAIQSFYSSNDIQLPKMSRNEKAKPLVQNLEIPSKEDLQQVLKTCDPLEKAIVLVGVSSGLAANEIINLKISDFKKGYDKETGITTLQLRRLKTNYDFITFLSPECSNAILHYLAYRARTIKGNDKRRLAQLEKQRVYADSNYLFIGRQILEEFLNSKNEELRKLEEKSLIKIYRTLSEKAHKNTPIGNWGFIRSHNMRKYFNSSLINAGADSFIVNFMMGHTLDDTQGAYFRAGPEKLKEYYMKFVPFVTIEKEFDVIESQEYLRLKNENQILISEVEKFKVERQEIANLKNEMENDRAKLKAEVVNEFLSELNKLSNFNNKLDLNEPIIIKRILNK